MLAAMEKVPKLERGEGFTMSAKTGDVEQQYSMQHAATLPASPSPTVSPTVSPPSSPSPTAEAEPPPTVDARPQGAAQRALGFNALFLSAEQSAAVFTLIIKQVEAEVRQREHLTHRARAISQPLARCRSAGASYQPAL